MLWWIYLASTSNNEVNCVTSLFKSDFWSKTNSFFFGSIWRKCFRSVTLFVLDILSFVQFDCEVRIHIIHIYKAVAEVEYSSNFLSRSLKCITSGSKGYSIWFSSWIILKIDRNIVFLSIVVTQYLHDTWCYCFFSWNNDTCNHEKKMWTIWSFDCSL